MPINHYGITHRNGAPAADFVGRRKVRGSSRTEPGAVQGLTQGVNQRNWWFHQLGG